jgi:hypothetical protein
VGLHHFPDAVRNIGNAVFGEGLRRIDQMR